MALWLLELGEAQCPKEHTCHLRSRLTTLFPEKSGRLTELLDLDAPITDDKRREEYLAILNEGLLPLLDSCSTLRGIRTIQTSGPPNAFLVTGPAQHVLARDAS